MRILVTGAAGSIGRVVTVGLVDRGHTIIGLDRVPQPDGEDDLSGTIEGDGSSTVFPIAEAVAEEFLKLHSGVRVTTGVSGTGGAVRASAVARPNATAMTTTSPTASRRKALPDPDPDAGPDSPARCRSSASIVTLRCHHPANPSATRAAALRMTRIP